MTESSADKKAEKNTDVIVDTSVLTWREFVLFSGGAENQAESAEMVRLVNKMIVNKDEINDLPYLEVFSALQAALTSDFNQISNPKN